MKRLTAAAASAALTPLGEFVSLRLAAEGDKLCREIVAFACRLGFDRVSVMVVLDDPGGGAMFAAVHSAPAGRRPSCNDRICNDRMNGKTRQEQARVGCRTGMALALHLPDGRHFFLGLDRDQRFPMDRHQLTRMATELQWFAVRMQGVALRALPLAEPGGRLLTARELECLRWTMEGKTAWEVGRILGTSEQTAARHLHNATKKLACANKHHAVVKALRLGLIQ